MLTKVVVLLSVKENVSWGSIRIHNMIIVTHLLNHTKPNLNPDMVRDSKLRTPLLVACAAGKADVVRALIRCGADVNNPMGDIVGNKPLDLAVISNNVDTVLALLEAGIRVLFERERVVYSKRCD